MKNINTYKQTLFIFALGISLAMSSCELLNPQPTDTITSEEAIKDQNGVNKAIIGSYSALQFSSYYGRNYIVMGDISTNNLIWTGTSPDYNQINNNSILADNLIVRDIWSTIYDGINRVNNVLAKLPDIAMSGDSKDIAYGECYFLRGLHHYNLVRLWGAVPVKTKPTTGNLADLQVSRDAVEVVYAQVISDLTQAESKLPDDNVAGRATKATARALLAKVYLNRYNIFKESADIDNAIVYSTQVINDPQFTLLSNYNNLFTPEANSESIFEVTFNPQDPNSLAVYYFTKILAGRYEFAPTDTLINSYDTSDHRKSASVAFDTVGSPYGYKYRDMVTSSDRVYVIRLAEMYLIRAEANNYKQADIAVIQADVNVIRKRAGLTDTDASTHTALFLAIENERKHEFAFEGQRWFDLTRTDRALFVLPNVTSKNQYLFPIPQSELQTNTNPGMVQNPGY
ncbi:MAG: RagB/SusD family nutrient uptake outer membrane protein [Bacteroidota bacterium]